jgi:predicted nuclease with RNAse H fold
VKGRLSIWVGADPGGKGKFGVAILNDDGQSQTALVSCADEAVALVAQRTEVNLAGVGVDAPLWWSSGMSGDRHADRWLRKRYKLSGGEVQAGNSLRGAALTQGAMFVQRMRELYAGVPVTESHPKTLLKAVATGSWKRFSGQHRLAAKPPTEHTRDALIAAVSARESFMCRWTHDLSATRLPGEQDPMAYWLAPVHYYWPEP